METITKEFFQTQVFDDFFAVKRRHFNWYSEFEDYEEIRDRIFEYEWELLDLDIDVTKLSETLGIADFCLEVLMLLEVLDDE